MSIPEISEIQEYLSEDACRDVMSECVRVIIINLLRQFLNESYPGGSKIYDIYRKRYFKALSSKVTGEIYSDEWDKKRFTFEHSLLDSGISTFLDTLSTDLVKRLASFIVSQQDNFTRVIAQNSNGNWKLDDENLQALDSFDFSLSFFQSLETMAVGLVKHVSSELILIKENQSVNLTDFLKLQIRNLIKDLSKEQPLHLPSHMPPQDFDNLLQNLFNQISNSERDWDVFFEVGNVDLKGEIMTLGNTTLFDARKWYKDESFEWDRSNQQDINFKSVYREYSHGFFKPFGSNERIKITFKRNSARAIIRVSASDHHIAVSRAKDTLKKIFTTMVFEYSDVNEYNNRPQISNRFQVMSSDGKEGTYSVKFDTSKILDVATKEKTVLNWYAESTLASHRTNRLDRAMSWFNAAYWEKESHAKYALYWIGLEQLLDLDAEGNNEGTRSALLRIIPKISVSWRDYRHERWVIGEHIKEITAKLSNNPDLIQLINKQDVLQNWTKRDYVMLENLPLIERLAKNSDISESIHRLQKWMEDERDEIINFVGDRRDFVEFQTAYLYARRNSIMHEGITESSNMGIFVNALENLLKKIISVSLHFASEKTWDGVSDQFNRPFSAGMR